MYNTCLRILNNELEAEDIMQESFLAAFEKIETYSGQVSFGAWLKRIVVNNSLDSLKKKKIEFKSVEDINNIDSPEEEPESNNKSEYIELKIGKVKEAINSLADGYRIILSLYLIEGYDHEEIAEIMNITSSTSRSQLTRAKKKLSELLTPNSN